MGSYEIRVASQDYTIFHIHCECTFFEGIVIEPG